jgi:hypothetical protein
MNITYASLPRHEKQFQHFSGVSVAEFDELYRRFEPAWRRAERERLQQRQRRGNEPWEGAATTGWSWRHNCCW